MRNQTANMNGALSETLTDCSDETCVTRKPLFIYKLLQHSSNKKEKHQLKKRLKLLREKIPEGYQIGAAVAKADSFFDALTQGLNELRNQGQIVSKKRFNVTYLRHCCRQFAAQAENGSWLDPALENILGVDRERYISAIGELNLNGQLKIDGKILCQQFGFKIKLLDLAAAEEFEKINWLKIGKSKHVVRLLKYRNHYVPLLSSIDSDANEKIKVAWKQVYGGEKPIKRKNWERFEEVAYDEAEQKISKRARFDSKVFDESKFKTLSDLNAAKAINESVASSGLKTLTSTEKERKRDSKNLDSLKETHNLSKRTRLESSSSTNNEVPQFSCKSQAANSITNKEFEFSSTVHEVSEFSNSRFLSYRTLAFLYQLDLSVLCLLRKSLHQEKYASLSIKFEDAILDHFKHIRMFYKQKYICIQIENVEKYYMNNDINFAQLFNKQRRSFSLKYYFEKFIKYLNDDKNELTLKNFKYLVIYTNAALELSDDLRLKKGKFFDFCAFKFDEIEKKLLKDLLYTNNKVKRRAFYQFSKDDETRAQLLKRFVVQVEGVADIEALKAQFFDKLVFAVNQPDREELHDCIQKELNNSNADYIALQKFVLSAMKPTKRLGFSTIYEFNLLVGLSHELYMNEKLFESINTEAHFAGNDLILNYAPNKLSYFKVFHLTHSIGYGQLFPTKRNEWRHIFSVNNCFKLYLEKLKKFKRLDHFIVYTNQSLDLTVGNQLKKMHSTFFYAFRFKTLNTQREKYEFLKACVCINENELFQFSKEDYKKLLSMLRIPKELTAEFQDELKIKNIKKQFLKGFILAVNQQEIHEFDKFLAYANVPYDYQALQEVAARYSESNVLYALTKHTLEKLLQDIKQNKTSYPEIERNIEKEIRFAKSVAGPRHLIPFLNYCLNGVGKFYMETLEKQCIKLSNVSGILNDSHSNAIIAFENLFNLWFDREGNKTKYLETLELHNINLGSVSNILHDSGLWAPIVYKQLFDLWFDEQNNKTFYLTTLEKQDIQLASICSILRRATINAATVFKDFFELCFDEEGNKSKYLLRLATEDISFKNVSGLLCGAGARAPKAFKDLYQLWFDDKGNTTQYIELLKQEGINLTNVTSILGGSGAHAAKAFKDLFELWFDAAGNRTQYLETLKKENISFTNISSILGVSGHFAAKAFKDLYELLFETDGTNCKTQYLQSLEREGITLNILSSILHRTGAGAQKYFKILYNLWFDENGQKTQYLRTLEASKIDLNNMSAILHGAATNGATSFKNLYDLWFDKQGEKTQQLKMFEKDGMSLLDISFILHGAGSYAPKVFRDLFKICYDEQGNKKTKFQDFFHEPPHTTTAHNLAGVIRKTGTNAKSAFESFHKICFHSASVYSPILNDFFDVGFQLNDILVALFGTGVHAASVLKNLHGVCFNLNDGSTLATPILTDFFAVGFKPTHICQMLKSASKHLVKYLKNFHDFCFKAAETRKYLQRFLNETIGFTPKNLANIFHGAGVFICSALKDFHDVCFDKKTSNESVIVSDFRKFGFRVKDLTAILSKAGIKANFVLKNFYKLCFDDNNFLNHFLNVSEIFTPKILAELLRDKGNEVCFIFEKLHELCFKKSGKKTKYFKKLIKHETDKVIENLNDKIEMFLNERKTDLCKTNIVSEQIESEQIC